jgi:hypothetical protein
MSFVYPPAVNPAVRQPWSQDPKAWEIANERFRANEAFWRFGELAALVSMWSLKDFQAGLVEACPTCNMSDLVISSVYQQPSYSKCPTCFGVKYAGPHGGVKSLLIKPTLWTWGEENTFWDRRGQAERQEGTVTIPGTSFLQVRDYIFRGDGYRFQVLSWSGSHLASGFETQAHTSNALTYACQVAREDPATSPAYTIPPGTEVLEQVLDPAYLRWPPLDEAPPLLQGPQY